MSSPSTPPVKARRLPRLQFSLRLLLIALTAFAIGFPIWYRWPYEEVEMWSPPGAAPPHVMQITTWQRQWGGGRLKHGLQRAMAGDEVFDSVMYRHGKKHGPAMRIGLSEKLEVVGHYVDDMKEGRWVSWDSGPKRTSTWLHDKLEGPYEIEMADGRQFHLLFAGGRLTHFNGQPARNRLFDLLEAKSLDSRLATELNMNTMMELVEVPLADVVTYLSEQHQLPFFLDRASLPDPYLPLTADYKGIDLCSALTLLTAPHELGCDYRYGMICISTAKDAEDWHDPSGVAEIVPPKGSALARAWNEPAGLEAVDQPLAPLLEKVVNRLAIEIDASRIAPTADNPNTIPITVNARGLPFRHILGLALYKTGCRCQLDGEKLVILPPPPDFRPPPQPPKRIGHGAIPVAAP